MNNEYLEIKSWLEETRDEPLENMASFFDARIGEYEEHMSPWEKYYKWMAELLPASIESLLDVGCGSGLELDEIFKGFPKLNVTGVDLSKEMLAKLKSKHSDKSLTLICDDYFKHDLGENKFDAAVSFETLHHFTAQKKKTLFEKILKSLKAGGVYLECDYIAVTQELEDMIFAECERRRKRDNIAPETFVHFDTPLTLENEMQIMKKAGFSKVELVGFLSGDNHTAMIRAIK